MSYLPTLRAALVDGAKRQQATSASEHRRPVADATALWRSPRWRWIALNLAVGLGGTLIGLTAAGVFQRGTLVGPEVRPSPTAGEGVAIPGSVKLLPLRVADPAGGPPWGLRMMRTTRGLTCVQAGRIEFGSVGVLGEDGAFGNDRRFHPLSENRHAPFDCAVTDARGNGFLNVLARGVAASALIGGGPGIGGCVLANETNAEAHVPRCPAGDVRDLFYGLLGPDAISITHPTASGALVTTAVGPSGSYLVVLPHRTRGCGPTHLEACTAGEQGAPGSLEPQPDGISAVRYRDGQVCESQPAQSRSYPAKPCPPVGFVPLPTRQFTPAELAMPVSVRKIPAKLYCEEGQRVEPCRANAPRGALPLTGGQPSLLVEISFVSRVGIPDTSSYEHFLSYAHSHGCTIGGEGGPTTANIHAGQRVAIQVMVPYSCPGVIHGSISYRPAVGPAGPLSPGGPGEEGAVPVGRFSFRVP